MNKYRLAIAIFIWLNEDNYKSAIESELANPNLLKMYQYMEKTLGMVYIEDKGWVLSEEKIKELFSRWDGSQ